MAFELPSLPDEYNALKLYIGAQTMQIHHDKHHATYVMYLPYLSESPFRLHYRLMEFDQLG